MCHMYISPCRLCENSWNSSNWRTSILTGMPMIWHILRQRKRHDDLLDVALLVKLAKGHVLGRRRRRQLRPAFVLAPSSHATHMPRNLSLLENHGVALLDDRRHETRRRRGFVRQRFLAFVAYQQHRLTRLARLVGGALASRCIRAARVSGMCRCWRHRRRRRRRRRHRCRRCRHRRRHRRRCHRYCHRRWWQGQRRERVRRCLDARRRALLDLGRHSHSFVIDGDWRGFRDGRPFPRTSTAQLPWGWTADRVNPRTSGTRSVG